MNPELLVVMPVFNEQDSLAEVVSEWVTALDKLGVSYLLFAIDDGSTDRSGAVLQRLSETYGDRLEVHARRNRGHGQSCLEGYRVAIDRRIPWILQIDSDGQCDPRYFRDLWSRREDAEVVYGYRRRRDDGLQRKVVSLALRSGLLLLCGVNCVDANVPYRLMRSDTVASVIDGIPDEFHLANVALAVLLRRVGAIERRTPIRFRARSGGEPSVKLAKFGSRGLELFRQLRGLEPMAIDPDVLKRMDLPRPFEPGPVRPHDPVWSRAA